MRRLDRTSLVAGVVVVIAGIVLLLDRLDEIDPDRCRDHARRFSPEAMRRSYEDLYTRLVGREARLASAPVG